MMLRTPPLKRRAQSKQPEDGSPNSGNRQLIIYEDTPLPESSHDHPETSDQMLCTYQCRQMVKSEFFDALSSAEKQARDSQSKLETLNNDYLKADAERKKFRDQFLNSEQELAAARGREEALQDQLLKEVNASQERLRKQLQLYSELEWVLVGSCHVYVWSICKTNLYSPSPRSEVIRAWFTKRWEVTAGIKVIPLTHNQFLFIFPSQQEATRVKEGEWFWNGRKLSLKWWSPVTGANLSKHSSEHKWVRAFGVPLHAWSESTFRSIGNLCGGFVGVDVETRDKSQLYWARICIKASLAEIPRTIEIDCGDWVYEISILQDEHAQPIGKKVAGVHIQKAVEVDLQKAASVSSIDRHVKDHVVELPAQKNNNLTFKTGSRSKPLENSLKQKGKEIVGPSGTKPLDHSYYSSGPKPIRTNNRRGKRENNSYWRAKGPIKYPPIISTPTQTEAHCDAAIAASSPTVQGEELGEEADDEAELGISSSIIPRQITDLSPSFGDDSEFSSHSFGDHLALPWYDSEDQVANPTVIETSKWTKLVLGKACKAFGVNVRGFENEILGMILRMEQRRQLELELKKQSAAKGKETSRKKGETEAKRLVCSVNYGSGGIKGKFQHEVNLRKKAETSAAASEEKASLLERKLSSVSESIKREKSRLQNDLEQLKSESKFSVTKISKNLERMEFRAANAEKESVLLKEQLEELRKRLDECVQQRIEAEKKLSNFTFQEGCSSDNILVKHLQDELRNCEAEVREARKLRSSHENIELLKVKLLEEKGRRDRAESELLKLADLQGDMKKLEDELTTWKSMVKDIPGVSCADDVPPKFAALQREVLDSMTKVGEVQARLKQMEVALDTAELEKRKAESEAAVAKESADSSKSEIKRIELKLVAVIEEKDRLKNVVEDLRKQKSVESGHEVVSGAILQGLEASLAKKEDAIKELESSLSEQKEVNIRQLNEINLLSEKLNNEARRIRSLEREGDRLRSEIALLESKLGHGDYSSANTKVLRMVNTLGVENEAKQTIEALQNELQKTKEKLLAIQELKEQSADAGTLVDSYISGKIMQLKEQIATLEKREERYKTVFADRISVFRRACCELFGYKIVMDDHHRPDGIPVTRFMLQSIYAQSDNEKLEFEYESGNTNILANTYTSQPEISRQVDIFIRKMNSIPAFTANLTVESFNKRTLS
ncbi:mitotic spindle checkpoint protein mad1 [Nicotiana attenuata]|uniref:Mitotic spindle checkpoint protein mad1 n=1 Tax=Nicotiana attenuata TaxID=49451 RepID=A0A314KLJ6_NICAT|nr:mitotic spindle checkpoint protein mad1 [Nicotiana attenuata]